MSQPPNFLRLNVGFIIHENVGYVRDFLIEIPDIYLPPELHLTNLKGIIRVSRAAQGLLVQIQLSAEQPAECVRCLKNFMQRLEINDTELYAFNRDSVTQSGLLVPENGKIDLEPIVREEMILAAPISPLCNPGCKGLCPICGGDLNLETCNHQESILDPRLQTLRTLLDQETKPK